MNKINNFFIQPNISLKDAMKKFDKSKEGILFVVDEDNVLKGSLSSGDIRRWLLKGGRLSAKISQICNKNPYCVLTNYNLKEVKEVMIKKRITCVPIVDLQKKMVDLLLWSDVFEEIQSTKSMANTPVVIMAGGQGTRLEPITKIIPKALIPLGDKSIVELIIDRFKEYKIKKFYLTINYKAEVIKAYFKDIKPDYQISYIRENKPLGTAGCLRYLINKVTQTFFLVNCDTLITNVNYNEILDFHKKGKFDLTIISALRKIIVPYGVCEIDKNGALSKIKEKPESNYLVNTGMYLLNPSAIKNIPKDKMYHMNQLIDDLMHNGGKIGVFPISEKSWHDIGEWQEYKKTVNILNL